MNKHQIISIGCMFWFFLGSTVLLTLTIVCAASAPTLVTSTVCDAIGAVCLGIIFLAHVVGGLALLPFPTEYSTGQRIRAFIQR